jgi:aminocarboxymuconate-semialdehyde decarboxylase
MQNTKLIDIHTHMVPRHLPGVAASIAPWPSIHCSTNDSYTMMLGDKPFRQIDTRSWDVERRCADMDRDGVSRQLLSPMPELLSYWQAETEAEHLADYVNGAIAQMVAAAPARFAGLGMVPLQNPTRAAHYVERLRERFGLIGVEIGSNVNGALPGEPQFAPVFAALEAYDLALFVHPLHPIATAPFRANDIFLDSMVGFPLDVAMAGASLVLSGVLTAHPNLRVALSHGGGALASILGRLDRGWEVMEAGRERHPVRPSEVALRFFYDSNVYDARQLRLLSREIAPGRVCLGTDYPYAMMQEAPADYIAGAGLDDQAVASLRSEAAIRFAKL